MQLSHISAITFFVTDMSRACRFYEKLGFELKFGGADAEFSSYFAGNSYLNLALHRAPEIHWGRVIFQVADVDRFYDQAIRNGLEPEFAPSDAMWGERYFHIRDPEGHELSFMHPLSDSTT